MSSHGPMPDSLVRVFFCGEEYVVESGCQFTVGREADLSLDDNPYLHRRFLQIEWTDGLWWIHNIGTRIVATVVDGSGMMQAWLGPGARLPLVFDPVVVVFSAGATTYEFDIEVPGATFMRGGIHEDANGETTVGEVRLTPTQFLLVLALAEPWLLQVGSGSADVPRSTQAAQRLGWSLTKFNRKLDIVADKLDRLGVGGLRGGRGSHAMHRRARLVEFAVFSKLVSRADLYLLDEEFARNAVPQKTTGIRVSSEGQEGSR